MTPWIPLGIGLAAVAAAAVPAWLRLRAAVRRRIAASRLRARIQARERGEREHLGEVADMWMPGIGLPGRWRNWPYRRRR